MPFPDLVLLEALDPVLVEGAAVGHSGSPACTLLQALSELLFNEQKDEDERIMRSNESNGIL